MKKITEDSLYRIKSLKVKRIMSYPLMHYSRKFQQRKFAKSEDSKRLMQFENSHNGERCIIIGNGPSLTPEDLEKTSNDITFASNRIYNIYGLISWRPDYYVAFEPTFIKDNIDVICQLDVRKAKMVNVCAKSNKIKCSKAQQNLYWIYSSQKYTVNKETIKGITFSTDISKYLGASYTVTFTMLQIAIYMGFKEIYLLGIDHYAEGENTHFY